MVDASTPTDHTPWSHATPPGPPPALGYSITPKDGQAVSASGVRRAAHGTPHSGPLPSEGSFPLLSG